MKIHCHVQKKKKRSNSTVTDTQQQLLINVSLMLVITFVCLNRINRSINIKMSQHLFSYSDIIMCKLIVFLFVEALVTFMYHQFVLHVDYLHRNRYFISSILLIFRSRIHHYIFMIYRI